jgi:outer membrane protein OmpA-like peptidoglycan-associated protein
MNAKAMLTTGLFLAFAGFVFWWWTNKKKDCNCGSAAVQSTTAAAPVAATDAGDLPLSFNWGDSTAIQGAGYAAYKKEQTANLGPSDTLTITTWYYEGEPDGERLALQRAESIRKLFADVAGTRTAVKVEKRPAEDRFKKEKFAAASFEINKNENSLVDVRGNRIIIHFATNSSAKQLEKEVDDYLTKMAADMKANPAMRVTATGYTDNVGADDKNLILSKNRAVFVRSALMAKGADSTRVSADGKGEADPLASNDTEAGRKENRRVELNINNQ